MKDVNYNKDNRIIYLDDFFAVVMKYSGDICEMTKESSEHSLSKIMQPKIEKVLGYNVECCECVHRLDRPVTGLCVLALQKDILAKMATSFSSGNVDKEYFAITSIPENFMNNYAENSCYVDLECKMIFDTKKQKARIVNGNNSKNISKSAKIAKLRYKILGKGERYLFCNVKLLTGRTHQIRCQLASLGMYIKGDIKYGSKRTEKNGGIRLHSWKLSFKHPKTLEKMTFSSYPPQIDSLWQGFIDLIQEKCDSNILEDNNG